MRIQLASLRMRVETGLSVKRPLESGKAKEGVANCGCGLFVGRWGRCFNLKYLHFPTFSLYILQNGSYQRAYTCISNIQGTS